MKIFLKLLVAIVLIGVGYFVYQGAIQNRESEESATLESVPTLAWTLEELPENPESLVPQTTVTLFADGSDVYTGTFTGSCSTIDGTSWTLQEGEVGGVVCWFAGGGNEVGVFSENGDYVVKVGDLDEGGAETPGFRGNFKTIVEL